MEGFSSFRRIHFKGCKVLKFLHTLGDGALMDQKVVEIYSDQCCLKIIPKLHTLFKILLVQE
jgi:hypothetical protein